MSNPSLVVRLVIDGKEFTGGVADAQKHLAALGKAGQVSAGQTAAAWRQLPQQMSDVAVQLQGGVNPLTILLQQGSQIQGSFGGLGPMFKELATVITPVNVALGGLAVGVGAVALAYAQGSQEQDNMARSLILTGNAAGTTVGQMVGMAQAIGAVVGTQAQASDALAQMAATGQVAAHNLQRFGEVAIRLERSVGTPVAETVKTLAELGRAPVAASVKLNESLNYLNKSIYDQIVALEKQKRYTEAASLAQSAYADAMIPRAAALDERLGYLQRGWRAAGEAANWAWDQMLNVGRAQTLQEQLAAAQKQLAEMPEPRRGTDPRAGEQRRAAVRARIDELRMQLYMEGEVAAAQAAADSRPAIRAAEDAARRGSTADHSLAVELAAERTASEAMLSVFDERQQRLDAANRAGLLSAQEYAQQRIDIIRREVAERQAMIDTEIALEARKPAATADEAGQRAARLAALEGQRSAVAIAGAKRTAQAQIDADQSVLDSARASAQAWADAWRSAQGQVRAAQDANADRAIGLIQDPQEQERARTARLNDLAQRRLSEALPELQRGLASAPNEGARDALQQQIDQLFKTTAQTIELNNRELSEKLKPQWQRNVEAWRDSNRLMRESWDDLMNSVQQNGEDAFVQFMQTGKLSVRSLVDDAIAQFARMQYREWLGKAGGLPGLLESGLGLVGSFFSGSASSVLGATGDFARLDRLTGARATGGPVSAGGLYLVGEAGPELLRMGASGGNVIPAQSVGRVLAAAAAPAAAGSIDLSFPATIYIDSRTDGAQVAQAVATGMAAVEKRMWAAMRVRGLVRG